MGIDDLRAKGPYFPPTMVIAKGTCLGHHRITGLLTLPASQIASFVRFNQGTVISHPQREGSQKVAKHNHSVCEVLRVNETSQGTKDETPGCTSEMDPREVP